jgi:hypothetical protein
MSWPRVAVGISGAEANPKGCAGIRAGLSVLHWTVAGQGALRSRRYAIPGASMIRIILTVVVATAVLAACGDGTGPRVPTDVEVDPQTISMETSDTVRVQAVVVDQSGRAYTQIPTGYQITWSTSAPLVAEVEDGLIRALRPGQAIITAQAGALNPVEIQVMVTSRTVETELSFSYGGFQTGTFDVDATFRLEQVDWDGDWALSWVTDEEDEGVMVRYHDFYAQQARSDGTVDWIFFWTVGEVTEAGIWEIDGGYFTTGQDLFDDSYEEVYFGRGTLNITAVGDRRLTGAFAMDMVALDENGERPDDALEITAGTLNIPVILFPTEVSGDVAAYGPTGALKMPERLRTFRETLRPRR